MNYKLIAATDKNRAIGKDNAMPWHLPEDFAHFKKTTTGGVVLMGRKTAQSLGRALPGRANLVLTRGSQTPHTDMIAVGSFEQAEQWAQDNGYDTIWVIGGEEVYTQSLDKADELVVTHVNTVISDADAYFPVIGSEWHEVEHTYYPQSERNPHAFDIVVYRK